MNNYVFYLPVHVPRFTVKSVLGTFMKYFSASEQTQRMMRGEASTAWENAPMETVRTKYTYGFGPAGFMLRKGSKIQFEISWKEVSMMSLRDEFPQETEDQIPLGLVGLNLTWDLYDKIAVETRCPKLKRFWIRDWSCYSGALYRAPSIPHSYSIEANRVLEELRKYESFPV